MYIFIKNRVTKSLFKFYLRINYLFSLILLLNRFKNLMFNLSKCFNIIKLILKYRI